MLLAQEFVLNRPRRLVDGQVGPTDAVAPTGESYTRARNSSSGSLARTGLGRPRPSLSTHLSRADGLQCEDPVKASVIRGVHCDPD
jgi:hypothetical protein